MMGILVIGPERNSNNFVIPPLNCSNNIAYNDVEKAEAFNTFFLSQSNIDNTDKSVPADDTPPLRCLDRNCSSAI
jgi:hypothetical protein